MIAQANSIDLSIEVFPAASEVAQSRIAGAILVTDGQVHDAVGFARPGRQFGARAAGEAAPHEAGCPQQAQGDKEQGEVGMDAKCHVAQRDHVLRFHHHKPDQQGQHGPVQPF